MKLHLPKQLFTALLTAITLTATPAAQGLEISGSGEKVTITLNAGQSYYGGAIEYIVDANGIGTTTSLTTKNNGDADDDVQLTFTLKHTAFDSVDCDSEQDSAKIIWVTSSAGINKTWGLAAQNKDTTDDRYEMRGLWENVDWTSDNDFVDIVGDALTTYTIKVGESGTFLAEGETLYQSGSEKNLIYEKGGLRASGGDKRLIKLSLNSAFIETFNVKEFENLTFTTESWSKTYNVNAVNNAAATVITVNSSNAEKMNSDNHDIIAGGNGQLKIIAGTDDNIELGNTIYLADSATAETDSISINNAGNVTLSGPLYLLENSRVSTTSAAGSVNITGKVTDKVIPEGVNPSDSEAFVCTGSTLSLSGTGYNFTGEVDVTGLTMLGGVAASFGNTASLGTLTSSGSNINSINVAGGSVNISALKGAANLAVSSSAAGGAFSANVTSGFTGSLDLNHNSAQTSVALSIQESATLKVVADSDNTITSVNLNNGSTLNYWTNNNPHTYSIGEAIINGNATISMAPTASWWQGCVNINALNSAVDEDGRALSGKLALKQNFRNNQRGVFNLNGGAYYGTIDFIGESGSSGDRNHILNIKSGSVAADAVINISGNDNSIMSMAIGDADVKSVTVRGLTGAGTIYSGEQVYGGGTTLASDGTTRTLIIDTDGSGRFTNEGTKGVYTSSATLKNGLNLQKDGEGSQIFNGNLSAFNGSVTVNQGTLTLKGTAAMNNVSSIAVTGGKLEIVNQGGFTLDGSATVSNGAELELGCSTSIGVLTAAGSTVSLAEAATLFLRGGTADAVTSHSIGVLNANGGTLALADYANLTIDTLNVSHTLDLTQGMGAELNITSLSVQAGGILESAGESDIVYIASLDAKEGTASGNGYQAAQGKKILIKGYEWTGTLDNVSYGDGNTYLTSDECTALSSIYYVQQGTVTLGGEQATAGVADATGFNVAKGTTLVVAVLPSGWSTTDMLTGKVTGAGRLQFASNVTVNHGDAVTTFGGELEVTGSGNVFTVQGNQNNYVNLTSLSNLIINNGAKIFYHATPDARTDGDTTPHLQKLSVESDEGTFYFKDSSSSRLYIGEASIHTGATMKLTSCWQDSAITIQKVTTIQRSTTEGEDAGVSRLEVYSPGDSSSSAVVNIESLKDFTGELAFIQNTSRLLTATVDTGSDGAAFKSLEVTNTGATAMGFTFNVQGNTSVGLVSLDSGTVSISEGKSLTLGGGTAEARKEHTAGTVTTGVGAGVSLGDYATLTLTNIPGALKQSYDNGNIDATSSLNLAISGGAGSVLDLALDAMSYLSGQDGWKRNSTVTLTQGENSQLAVRVSSGYLANCVFGVTNQNDYGTYATTNLGGSALSMADGTALVLRKPHASEDFGAGDITLEGAVALNLYGSVAADDTSLTNNISGGTLTITNTGGITLAGNLSNMALVTEALGDNETRNEVILSGESISLTALTHNNGTLTVNGALTMGGILHVQDGTLKVVGNLLASDKILELSGSSNADGNANARIRLEGATNTVGTLDFGKNGHARGTLELGAGSTTTAGALYMNNAVSINMERGAQLTIGTTDNGYYTVTGKEGSSSIGIDKSGQSTANEYKGQFVPENDVRYILSNVDVSVAKSVDTTFSYKLTDSSITNTGSGTLTVSNAGNTITNLVAEKGDVKVSESMRIDSISAKSEKTVSISAGKTVSMKGGVSISAAGTEDATMKAKSDNAVVQIDELAEDASFTITEMNFSNASISAAKGIKVKLEKITTSDNTLLMLTGGGQFQLYAGPQEMTLDEATAEGMNRTLTYSSGLGVSGEGTTLTLNLDVVNAVAPDQHGVYDISIVLSGFGEGFALNDDSIAGMVKFDPDSWLAKALEGVTATVLKEGTVATTASNDGPTVTYAAGTGENVGSLVITINGLNVPEPASATLGLAALMMLAARRRRRA